MRKFDVRASADRVHTHLGELIERLEDLESKHDGQITELEHELVAAQKTEPNVQLLDDSFDRMTTHVVVARTKDAISAPCWKSRTTTRDRESAARRVRQFSWACNGKTTAAGGSSSPAHQAARKHRSSWAESSNRSSRNSVVGQSGVRNSSESSGIWTMLRAPELTKPELCETLRTLGNDAPMVGHTGKVEMHGVAVNWMLSSRKKFVGLKVIFGPVQWRTRIPLNYTCQKMPCSIHWNAQLPERNAHLYTSAMKMTTSGHECACH